MSVVAPNRREFPISMVVVVAAVAFQVVPIGFVGALVPGGGMGVGLICVLNAFLDRDEMGFIEIYVAGLWLIVMLIMTPLTLYWLATIREFANK